MHTRLGALAISATLGLELGACSSRPAFVVLTVQDPQRIAADWTEIAVGASRDVLEPKSLRRQEMPVSLTVTSRSEGLKTLWVEARDLDGRVLGRGKTDAIFQTRGTSTATVLLAKPCVDVSECSDEVYCDGVSVCVDTICESGTRPCVSSFACVVSACVEAAKSCSVTVDHTLCPADSYCDLGAGCVVGQRCVPENNGSECQDGRVCNGLEQCVNFHCLAGIPPDPADDNPCTLDACAEPSGPVHMAVADGNVCPMDGVARAVCREGNCLASSCGDGFVDRNGGEYCDDGAANADNWSVARHCNATCSAWAAFCGDIVIQTGSGEECDDGLNNGSPLGCMPDCTLPQNCGDGRLAASRGETCDDGNTNPGDGCTPACAVQDGWSCDASTPSRCALGAMIVVEPGTFTMGSPSSEAGREADEVEHVVILTRGFAISNTEVTQAEFQSVMGWDPSAFAGCASCPVEQMSYYDAAAYLNELTRQQGGTPCYVLSDVVCVDATAVGGSYMSCMSATRGGIGSASVSLNAVASVYDCAGFRLPTEAEWEYAARAGDARATYHGDLDSAHLGCEEPNDALDSIAWFCGNAGSSPHPTGTRAPNAWGLYDMLGNVHEWCHDWYGGYVAGPVTDPEGVATGWARVQRGGRWSGSADLLRAASRSYLAPEARNDNRGIRVVRTLP